MSTSDKQLRSDALRYLAAAIFTALFGAVYECFGRGVWSFSMIYAFALPLVLGVLPALLLLRKERREPSAGRTGDGVRHAGAVARNAWASGVATLTVGCVFRGALEIFGTTNRLTAVYPLAGGILLLAGILAFVYNRSK